MRLNLRPLFVATLIVFITLAVEALLVLAHAATTFSAASQYHSTAPTRVMDTRNSGGALANGSTRTLDLSASIPADATAVTFNLTVIGAGAGGYVEAFPDGVTRPLASMLNYLSGQTIANGATVQLTNGKIDFYNQGGTAQLIVDLAGYFEPPAASPSTSSPAPTASSASPSPSSSPTAPVGYVQPGSVGYLGATSALTVYKPGGAAPLNCSWQSYGLRCNDDNITWDHVWIQGSVYWAGTGTLKVTNSIITGDSAQGWYALLGHTPQNTSYPGATIDVEDSTVGFSGTAPNNVDSAPIWSAYGNQRLVAIRDDLSGLAQGIDPTDSSVIQSNWIHGLVQNGTGGTTVHLDGIFSQGGANILIQGNYVDAPVRSDTTAAIFIQDLGGTDTGISIKSNYLSGGAYELRNQTGVNVDVEGNTFNASGSLYGYVGDTSGYPGTYGTWTGNVDTNGAVVPKP